MGAHAEHVLGQLLGDGRRTTGVAPHDGILDGTQDALEVDATVVVETLVFSVDERVPEYRGDIVVVDGTAVLVEKLAYEFAIAAKHLGGDT